jgi:hypothetical protein
MLTETGYTGGLVVYCVSAVLAVLLMNLWLLRGRSTALRLLLSLPVAALLLTPAYIQPGADTLAPALVVVAFQWLSQGPEAAQHALSPLLLFTGAAASIGVFLALILLWLGRGADEPSAQATS